MQQKVKIYRCRKGSCNRLATNVMISYYGKCYNCWFKEFTGPGRTRLGEELMLVLRHCYAKYKLKGKQNETVKRSIS